MIREDRILKNKLKNSVHAVVLIVSMLVLIIFLGFLLAGIEGIVWAAFVGLILFITGYRISPKVILRMYHARPIAPDDAPQLHHFIRQLSSRANLPAVPQPYYIPSRIMNAFSVGSRNDAAIGLTDGLLRNLDSRELAGVLAHEISHIHNNDMKVMRLADIISRVTSILSISGQLLLVINLPLFVFGMVTIPWFGIFLLIAAPTMSGLLQLALSRSREFEADLEAVRISGDPKGLALALRKLENYKMNIFERLFVPGRGIPDPSIFRTHPRTEERIRRLLSLEQEESKPDYTLWNDTHHPLQSRKVVQKPRWYWSGLWY